MGKPRAPMAAKLAARKRKATEETVRRTGTGTDARTRRAVRLYSRSFGLAFPSIEVVYVFTTRVIRKKDVQRSKRR